MYTLSPSQNASSNQELHFGKKNRCIYITNRHKNIHQDFPIASYLLFLVVLFLIFFIQTKKHLAGKQKRDNKM